MNARKRETDQSDRSAHDGPRRGTGCTRSGTTGGVRMRVPTEFAVSAMFFFRRTAGGATEREEQVVGAPHQHEHGDRRDGHEEPREQRRSVPDGGEIDGEEYRSGPRQDEEDDLYAVAGAEEHAVQSIRPAMT